MSNGAIPSDGSRLRAGTRRAALIGLLASLGLPAAASANLTNITTGRAFDFGAKVGALSTFLTIGPDTGVISTNQNTSTSQNAGSLSSPLGSGSLLNVSVVTSQTEGVVSKANIAKMTLTVPGLPVITGTLISSQSATTCRNHNSASGGSAAGTLVVNGATHSLAAPPNTVIPLGPLGSITINEQVRTLTGLTVNAIDVQTVLGTRVIVASTLSDVQNCA